MSLPCQCCHALLHYYVPTALLFLALFLAIPLTPLLYVACVADQRNHGSRCPEVRIMQIIAVDWYNGETRISLQTGRGASLASHSGAGRRRSGLAKSQILTLRVLQMSENMRLPQ